ncbi:hypothetical protein ACTXI0_04670 [Arthrobacter rhombi]|uniref:hypothetical protein n=1 Tax=Arthrobacter rhombi TaxID=71253 RepID=UPI003FD4D26F
MSDMNGNPHIHHGSQIADPDTINEGFIAEEGITAKTVILSELTRNTEATLAVAYEQRTANLIAAFNASVAADEEIETFIGERIDTFELAQQIVNRLGLNGDAA